MQKKAQSEILGIVFMIVIALVLILILLFYGNRPTFDEQGNLIIIANRYYNTIFSDNLYTNCSQDMSFLTLLRYYFMGLVTECDDGSNVESFLNNYINKTLRYFLANNGLAYKLIISDSHNSLSFENGVCNGFVYYLPTQTILKPDSGRINISLSVCKRKR
ncbi:MAG: hypothetical protein PWP03_440 [Candidatus Woesearchaeota archaeon]|nr:hypothetical protein [Candidatus Woesearchaeota archaeon]MDN5327802.1 hypothetical protein [Candidatus Woesearchaeota archaeon]